MFLELVKNPTCQKNIQIWLFRTVFYHKVPVLNMKITLVFSSQDNTTKNCEISRSERKMQITITYTNIHQQINMKCICLELRSKAKLKNKGLLGSCWGEGTDCNQNLLSMVLVGLPLKLF